MDFLAVDTSRKGSPRAEVVRRIAEAPDWAAVVTIALHDGELEREQVCQRLGVPESTLKGWLDVDLWRSRSTPPIKDRAAVSREILRILPLASKTYAAR